MKKLELAHGEVATGEATGDAKRKRTTYTADEKMAIVAEWCRKLAPLMGAALAEMTNRKLRAGSRTTTAAEKHLLG